MNNIIYKVRWVGFCACLLTLVACVSSGPATKFYSLFASESITRTPVSDVRFSMGVGPIVLPEYLENSAIVSLTDSQRLRVAGYHAWAGDLKESIGRVLAGNLSMALDEDAVWAFPWDNRVRPSYQLRIVFERFDGVRGGRTVLRAKWTLLDKHAQSILAMGSEGLSVEAASESIEDYVAALNKLLNEFSGKTAASLHSALSRGGP